MHIDGRKGQSPRHVGRGPLWGSILALAVAVPATGQETGSCPGGVTGDFGIAGTGCAGTDCVLTRIRDGRERDGTLVFTWLYPIEPDIYEVRAGSPVDGVLRPGDRIVSVDGIPITTREGSRRLEHPRPGDVAVLAFRREGRLREVRVRAEVRCTDEDETALGLRSESLLRGNSLLRSRSLVRGGRSPVEAGRRVDETARAATGNPAVGRPTRTATPDVHLGMTFECSNCVIETTGTGVRWTFSQPPRVLRVEPGGPAARAGLRAGDLIRGVGGHAIESPEGGEAFGRLTPGTAVRVVVSRPDGSRATVSLVPERPRAAVADADPGVAETPTEPEEDRDPLRFTGMLGDAAVEVRGGPVTVDHLEGEGVLVIYTESNVIRIRVPSDRD